MFWNKKEKKTNDLKEQTEENQGPNSKKGPRIQTAEGWNRTHKNQSPKETK